MALATRLGPSSSPPLDTVIAPTLPKKRTGPSREFTAAVRLRRSSRISAEASASTRRRDLPREPRSSGDVGTAGVGGGLGGAFGGGGEGGGGGGAAGGAGEGPPRGGGRGLRGG